jgi:hypothetical protein
VTLSISAFFTQDNPGAAFQRAATQRFLLGWHRIQNCRNFHSLTARARAYHVDFFQHSCSHQNAGQLNVLLRGEDASEFAPAVCVGFTIDPPLPDP